MWHSWGNDVKMRSLAEATGKCDDASPGTAAVSCFFIPTWTLDADNWQFFLQRGWWSLSSSVMSPCGLHQGSILSSRPYKPSLSLSFSLNPYAKYMLPFFPRWKTGPIPCKGAKLPFQNVSLCLAWGLILGWGMLRKRRLNISLAA